MLSCFVKVDDPSLANSDGITALHNAVCGNHEDVVRFLVEYGCDVNLPDSHGWYVISFAHIIVCTFLFGA